MTTRSTCEECGKEYETYAIIIDCNPLSIASLLEEEEKTDGTFRRICSDCRERTNIGGEKVANKKLLDGDKCRTYHS